MFPLADAEVASPPNHGLPVSPAWDPAAFRCQGHAMVESLALHLEACQKSIGPVLPPMSSEEAVSRWSGDFSPEGRQDFLGLMGEVMAQSNHLHHPRYLGHQVATPLPMAALAGLVAGLLNNSTAVFETGPVGVAMERALIRWIALRAGWNPDLADGTLCSGGSLGNLTALLAAKRMGTAGGEEAPLRLICSDQTHYSVARAAGVMGLDSAGLLTLGTDSRFRMSLDALRQALVKSKAEGRRILAVVASAGSTATGAVDPLEGIADLCGEHGAWLHVDGAHGGAALLSDCLRTSLKGLERADSFIVDGHKMLLVPSLATLLCFRDGPRSYATFSQDASYLFECTAWQEWFNPAHRTLECTRPVLALPLYAALYTLGTAFFARFLERAYALTTSCARLVSERSHWDLATPPDGNILCFRYAHPGLPDVDAFQAKVRRDLVAEGDFYLVKTSLRGSTWLRCTFVNPHTRETDFEALLERVEGIAARALRGHGIPTVPSSKCRRAGKHLPMDLLGVPGEVDLDRRSPGSP